MTDSGAEFLKIQQDLYKIAERLSALCYSQDINERTFQYYGKAISDISSALVWLETITQKESHEL